MGSRERCYLMQAQPAVVADFKPGIARLESQSGPSNTPGIVWWIDRDLRNCVERTLDVDIECGA